MLECSKNHVWSLEYPTTCSQYKDPSTLVIKERQVKQCTHSYDLDPLTKLC